MRYRLLLVGATIFFVVMNVLLWRSEFSSRAQVGGLVQAETVWDKVLNAPDDSRLEIRLHGKKIGYCLWSASIGESRHHTKIMTDEPLPEGMMGVPSNYRIDCDGTVAVNESTRIKFTAGLKLSTNQAWEEFVLSLKMRPLFWEIRANAPAQTLQLDFDEGAGRQQKAWTFADLANPQKFLRSLGSHTFPGALAALGFPLPTATNGAPSLSLGLVWEARRDRLAAGHLRLPAYRLRARVLDRLQVTVYVGNAGEILRVELPGDIVLQHDMFLNL